MSIHRHQVIELGEPMDEIQEMEDECDEIHSGGLLKRYAERPASLQNATLADWAAWYDSSKHFKKKTKITQIDLDNFPTESLIDEETNDDDVCDDNMTDKSQAKGGIKKRTNSRVIRSVSESVSIIVKLNQKNITVSLLCFLLLGEMKKLI